MALNDHLPMQILNSKSFSNSQVLLITYNTVSSLSSSPLSKEQLNELKARTKAGETSVHFWHKGQHILCEKLENSASPSDLEKTRIAANKAMQFSVGKKAKDVAVFSTMENEDVNTAFIEGLALSNYTFNRHLSKDNKKPEVQRIRSVDGSLSKKRIDEIKILAESVFIVRDLVNEPVNHLNATGLANACKKTGKAAGFKVEVLNKQKISALKMGGLLAVNIGSPDPPTFSIMTYSPKNAVNTKPLVLVGKGVVYDTGGLSLKPTANSMDHMKCDMGGAATVIGTMHAIASLKLPVKIIGLIPATDNRPGGNAYTPGDVIRMHNGTTVEVLNTDAEGRMILADALSYAEKYDPELVIDIATLTGSAMAAIGSQGSVIMGTAPDKVFKTLVTNGEKVHERFAHFPFWDEFDDQLKSDIADAKNLGGPTAGAITAGKFLNRFTTKPHVHIDIAGTAYSSKKDAYRPKGGTGIGVRALVATIKDLYNVG